MNITATYGGSYAWVRAGASRQPQTDAAGESGKDQGAGAAFAAAGRDHMVDNDAIARFAEETERTKAFLYAGFQT